MKATHEKHNDNPVQCFMCEEPLEKPYKTILGGFGDCCGTDLMYFCSKECLKDYLKRGDSPDGT